MGGYEGIVVHTCVDVKEYGIGGYKSNELGRRSMERAVSAGWS